MPKAANIEVTTTVQDRYTKGHWSRDELWMYPKGTEVKGGDKHKVKHNFGTVKVARADLPEYALNALDAGRPQPFTKKASAYETLMHKYASKAPEKKAPAKQEKPKKQQKAEPSIEQIMLEAEKENARRDAENAVPSAKQRNSKLTKADLERRNADLERENTELRSLLSKVEDYLKGVAA